jgi:hypothetical protein
MKDIKEAVGKTIASVERIPAEYGRTYHSYTLIVFTSGEKVMLADGHPPNDPRPTLENMQKAPQFFTAEDIADKMLRIEQEKRRNEKERTDAKRRELERLKKELGE